MLIFFWFSTFLVLGIVLIISIFEDMGIIESIENTLKALVWAGIPIMLSGLIFSYIVNTQSFYGIRRNMEIDIPNQISFLKNMNKLVAVRVDGNNMIIDIANMGQSVKNTDQWKDLVNSIENYNKKMTSNIFAKEHPVLGHIYYGAYPKIPDDFKYIKLNEIIK